MPARYVLGELSVSNQFSLVLTCSIHTECEGWREPGRQSSAKYFDVCPLCLLTAQTRAEMACAALLAGATLCFIISGMPGHHNIFLSWCTGQCCTSFKAMHLPTSSRYSHRPICQLRCLRKRCLLFQYVRRGVFCNACLI